LLKEEPTPSPKPAVVEGPLVNRIAMIAFHPPALTLMKQILLPPRPPHDLKNVAVDYGLLRPNKLRILTLCSKGVERIWEKQGLVSNWLIASENRPMLRTISSISDAP
jgi:hypothetical protein